MAPTRENLTRSYSNQPATGTSWKIKIVLVASLDMILSNKPITKVLIRLRISTGWSAPLLFANPEDRFSCVETHIKSHWIDVHELLKYSKTYLKRPLKN